MRDHPRRFGLLAALPLPDLPGALAESRRAIDELGADGITLHTHYAGRHLGDPFYEPLMTELDQRSAVVFVHPTSPPCWEATSMARPRPMLEFPFETTRAVTHLILNGVLDRYPRIRFIVPHAGAALPAVADRVAAFALAMDGPPVDVLGALRPALLRPRRLPSATTAARPPDPGGHRSHPLRKRLSLHTRLGRPWPGGDARFQRGAHRRAAAVGDARHRRHAVPSARGTAIAVDVALLFSAAEGRPAVGGNRRRRSAGGVGCHSSQRACHGCVSGSTRHTWPW